MIVGFDVTGLPIPVLDRSELPFPYSGILSDFTLFSSSLGRGRYLNEVSTRNVRGAKLEAEVTLHVKREK